MPVRLARRWPLALLALLASCPWAGAPSRARSPVALVVTDAGEAERLGVPEAVAGDGLLVTGTLRAMRAGPERGPLERDRWLVRDASGARASLRFSMRDARGRRRLPTAVQLEVREGRTLFVRGPGRPEQPVLVHAPLPGGVVSSRLVEARPAERLGIELVALPGRAAFGAGLGWRDPWSPDAEEARWSRRVLLPLRVGWLVVEASGGLRWRVEPDTDGASRRWVLWARRLRWTVAGNPSAGLARLTVGRSFSTLRWRRPLPAGTRLRLSDDRGRPWLDVRPPKEGAVRLAVPPGGKAWLELPGRRRGPAVEPRPGETRRLPDLPKGGRLVLRLTNASGKGLAARLRLRALKDAPTPSLGPDWLASGAGDTVLAEDGHFDVRLPPGRYRAWVTHGPAYEAVRLAFRLGDETVVERRVALHRQVDTGSWVPADLHLHAAPSVDSRVPLGDRLLALRAEGIRFAVATDHNRVTDYAAMAPERAGADLSTAAGVEVTTWNPAFGHFNVYPVPFDALRPDHGAPPYQGFSGRTLLASLRERFPEALVQVCHPRLEPNIGYFDLYRFAPRRRRLPRGFSLDFDLLEVFNGYDLARPERVLAVLHDWLALLRRGRRVVGVGSSDSHQIRFHLAGYPRTWVRVSDARPGHRLEARAVFAALRDGHAVVSSGPFLQVDAHRGGETPAGGEAAATGVGPGDVMDLPAVEGATRLPVRVTVRLSGPAWMPSAGRLELWTARGRRAELRLPEHAPGPWHLQRSVVIQGGLRDAFLVVVYRGDHTLDGFFGREGVVSLAFSNPIWLVPSEPIR